MNSIDFLEHGGLADERFAVVLDGESYWMPDPREEHYQWVLMALHFGHVPGTPPCPEWQRRLVFERWCAAYDLPVDFASGRRLAYLVDHYRAPMATDLQTYANLDLVELWRARRWMTILDLVDRLPAHSWFAATVTSDEDHAKMIAESLAAREESGEETKSSGPALTTWTPEVAVMTNILDAVRGVQHAVVAVQAPKDKQPQPPKPSPRPVTPLERALKAAEFNRRKAKHEALVARVLPHKAKPVKP